MKLTKEQAHNKYPDVGFMGNNFYIKDSAVINIGVFIYNHVIICEGAVIKEGVIIHEGAVIYEGAIIRKGAVICEGAVIREGAIITANSKNVRENIVIHGIGETKNITAFFCDKGLIINIGCFNGNIEKTQKEISKRYPDEHSYNYALLLIQAWAKEVLKNRKN